MRKVIKWNENWGFLKGERQQDVVWEVVTLPHTWNALDGQDGGNDYYQGPAWYKKTLTLESDWKEVYIRFGAVNKKAEVWCNGKSAGAHQGGFSAFTFDLTPFLEDGENEILVKADNSNELPIYPRQADFTFFGGIYREVELICFDEKAHFDVTRFGTDAIFVMPSMDGTVVVDTYVVADSSVYAEIPFISVYDEREEADENLRQQMQELVLQNYNHPSICFWGIANEVGIGGESEKMYQILRELNQLTRKLDPSRLTVIANVGMTRTDSPLFHITDVTSYNEYKGWYEGTMDEHGTFCDERHNEIPAIPLAISEYGAESILSWHSEHPKVKDYSEEYQALLHEKAEKAFEERPYLWATWLWNMFDFAADARDEGGCKGRNNKGLVTYDRSIKKQAFYFYKACWSKEPFVYLCGKRFTKRAEEKINIKVYSNQKQVDLWVNGEHIGSLCESAVFEFKEVVLSEQFNEILVRTPDGLMDTLILEKVDKVPEEYVFIEEKNVSDAVTQWFANLQSQKDDATVVREIVVREGYLSVNDSMEEIYKYPEGFQAVQELIAMPMAAVQPAMAERMATGGVLSFASIWNHIGKLLPDEAYYLLNERLNKIKK